MSIAIEMVEDFAPSPAGVRLLDEPERLEVVGGRGLERCAGREAIEEMRDCPSVRRLVVGIEIDLLRDRAGADQLERGAGQADGAGLAEDLEAIELCGRIS